MNSWQSTLINFWKLFLLSENEYSNPEKILHCYPNPFQYRTAISCLLTASGYVEMSVYDITGRKVTTLISGDQPSGVVEVLWKAEGLPSGFYFCEMKYNRKREVIKVIKGY